MTYVTTYLHKLQNMKVPSREPGVPLKSVVLGRRWFDALFSHLNLICFFECICSPPLPSPHIHSPDTPLLQLTPFGLLDEM